MKDLLESKVAPSEIVKGVVKSMSGGFCMNPDCRRDLLEEIGGEHRFTGEIAHIHGEKKGAERFLPSMTDEERDAEPNLMALCRNCHGIIDKRGAAKDYPSSLLHRWKAAHLREVADRAARRTVDVGDEELIRIVRGLVHGDFPRPDDDVRQPPTHDEKIAYNDLSDEVRQHIRRGLARRQAVERYLDHERRIYPDIHELIRGAIIAEYRRQRRQASGDALFYAIWASVGPNLYRDEYRAAALVVVAYFFEVCDIFERPVG